MKSAEHRVLRFLHAASSHESWVPYRTILNTEDLLPGDEKALATLMWRGLVEESPAQAAYRLSETGLKAVRRTSDAQWM
jgi:RIO-like serine/threonine protein kinase